MSSPLPALDLRPAAAAPPSRALRAAPAPAALREVDVSIVTYRPDFGLLRRLLASLLEVPAAARACHLHIHDNSGDEEVAAHMAALAELRKDGGFASVALARSSANLGFGQGHNRNAACGKAPYLLVLNQDCVLEPAVLSQLLDRAAASPPEVAAWELRQIPYEHPKAYDPVTLDTRWVSGAATLFRRKAFEGVGGFEPRIFMYGEDVDLSWRLRAAGWRLLYQPALAVEHRTYRSAGEAKPLQVFGGVLASLCLRARFGTTRETLAGLGLLSREICRPQSFPGRRLGLLRAGLHFAALWPHFARTRIAPATGFHAHFPGWDFETHREGAFHELRSARVARDAARPLVSILIRTVGRPAWLRQALASCAHQTYPNLEVVVIEDGPMRSRDVVEEFTDRLRIRYRATGARVGRARAGNLALQAASGEWLNFLDDDDLFFADHVEVLVEAVLASGAPGAYALAWETRTRVLDREHAIYEEVAHTTRHREPFDRFTLWHHNFLPIQTVLFHRRLYERHGGFAEDMEHLEDWNLWTRYTLESEFALVPKTTSKYRVPADPREEAERNARLDRAYVDAVARQAQMRGSFSPREITSMAASFARRRRLLARLARRYPRLGAILEGRSWIE